MNNTNNNFESDKTRLQQITLAHAVRSHKKPTVVSESKTNQRVICNERTANRTFSSCKTPQIKETYTMKYGATPKYQVRPHLPLNMIVSKMATRKPVQGSDQENEDPFENIDISLCRKFKLTPPPWRNRLNQTKRLQPSGFKKIVDNMKEKCSQFNENMEEDLNIFSQDRRQSDLNNLLVSIAGSNKDEMNTTSIEYNFNMLYGKLPRKRSPVKCRDEDPLPDTFKLLPKSNSQAVELSANHSHSTPPENAEFSPRCSPRQQESTEFVWDPVIVTKQSERLFSPLQDRANPHFQYLTETRRQPRSPQDRANPHFQYLTETRRKPRSPQDRANPHFQYLTETRRQPRSPQDRANPHFQYLTETRRQPRSPQDRANPHFQYLTETRRQPRSPQDRANPHFQYLTETRRQPRSPQDRANPHFQYLTETRRQPRNPQDRANPHFQYLTETRRQPRNPQDRANPHFQYLTETRRQPRNPQDRANPHFQYLTETRRQPRSPHDCCYTTSSLPTFHNSPSSPGNYETSSTSSGQTIAEESLQLTYFTKRGASQLDGNIRQPCAEIRQQTSSVRCLWPDNGTSFLKFLEE